jgi:hypothetical protein
MSASIFHALAAASAAGVSFRLPNTIGPYSGAPLSFSTTARARANVHGRVHRTSSVSNGMPMGVPSARVTLRMRM